jgi:hypothetical protein
MTPSQQELYKLLTSLESSYSENLIPTSLERIERFEKRAMKHGLDKKVIEQLTDLYKITDSFSYIIVIGFHPCDDEMIFQWWDNKELWIGQRDFNTLRWSNNKFCLGDAGNISYSPEHEYDSLIELIKGCMREIKQIEQNQ